VVALQRVKERKGKEDKPAEKPRPKAAGGVRHKADYNGFAVVGPAVKEGQVEFEFTYGRNVEGIARFVVGDTEGDPLWVLLGGGQNCLRKITYGVVPFDRQFDRSGLVQQQQYPPGNKKPEDIRGSRSGLKSIIGT
jgi:hypothetical protein